MPHYSTVSALMVSLALSACTTLHTPQPQYTLEANSAIYPTAEIQRRYHLDEAWWKQYGDGRLNHLIEQALANNIELKQAAISVNQALYQANILGASLTPSFNASLDAGRSQNLKTGDSSQSYSSQLGLSYELDLWRKLSSKADAQIWAYQASAEDLASTRLTIINNVADAYFNIAYLNEAIRLNRQTRQDYAEIKRIADAKYRHGKVASIDARQAEQSLLNIDNTLSSLEDSRADAEAVLRNLLNLKPNEAQTLNIQQFALPSELPTINLDVPISALANRPDLRAAEYRLQAAYQNQEAQKRSWYPSISIGASLSASSNQAKTLFNIPMLGGSIRLNLPFLDWKTLQWEDKTAAANFDSARLKFEQTITTALNEVATNYRKFAHAYAQLKTAAQQYQLSSQNSRYYRQRYLNGKNELSDWLNARTNQYSAQQTMLSQRYEALKYANMVYKSMAGKYLVKG